MKGEPVGKNRGEFLSIGGGGRNYTCIIEAFKNLGIFPTEVLGKKKGGRKK